MLEKDIFIEEKNNNRIYLRCLICNKLVKKYRKKGHRCHKNLNK